MVQPQMQATGYDQHFDQGLVHQAPSEGAVEGNSSSVRPTKRKAVDSGGRQERSAFALMTIQNLNESFRTEKLTYTSTRVRINIRTAQTVCCAQTVATILVAVRLKRHAESKQCAKNQEKSKISAQTFCAVAPVNLATSTFVAQTSVSVPQGPFTFKGTRLATQQALPSSVTEPKFSSATAQPVVEVPRLNSMTQKVTPFPVFAQNSLSLPDLRSSVQVPNQPSGVLPTRLPPKRGKVTRTFLAPRFLLHPRSWILSP
ncbi:hypothetical protein EDB19DRAFT_1947344, partial [Suillus lakei]